MPLVRAVVLRINATRETLGVFRNYHEAKEFHDKWCEQFPYHEDSGWWEAPSCSFQPITTGAARFFTKE